MPLSPPSSHRTNLIFMELICTDMYMYLTKSTVKGESCGQNRLWALSSDNQHGPSSVASALGR